MKITAIITTALIIFSATTSMASDCAQGSTSGRFKNTNPAVKTASAVKASTQTAVR